MIINFDSGSKITEKLIYVNSNRSRHDFSASNIYFLILACAVFTRPCPPARLRSPCPLASPSAPSPVGTALNWTASASGVDPSAAEYQFSVAKPLKASTVVIDYSPSNTFQYMPLQEGTYTISVTVKNTITGESASTSAAAAASSLLGSSGAPLVTPTGNPLTAIYSATCQTGTMRVFFAPTGTTPLAGMGTSIQNCVPGKSVNFVAAGMIPNTQYTFQHEIAVGFSLSYGPLVPFTTGNAAPGFPAATVHGATTDWENVFLYSMIGLSGGAQGVAAYDSKGNTIWAYPRNFPNAGTLSLLRPVSGGTMLVTPTPTTLAEIDLLGNTVRQTSATRMNEQLAPLGYPFIDNFNHDAVRLPNGYTAAIVQTERIYTDGTQGSTPSAPVDILGSGIVVLDQNFQVVWSWNPYAKFDMTRPSIFTNYTCPGNGCTTPVTLLPNPGGLDYMHGNALILTDEGNFLLSMRHQNLIIKIDYNNGAGPGDVIWRFGAGGDFTLTNPNVDPWPWFSGQHSSAYHGNQMTLFDNGISRVTPGEEADFSPSPALCCSRGQMWTLNESARTATLSLNVSMGTFSDIIGSSQWLFNGNFHYLSGFAYGGTLAEVKEFTPAGVAVFTMDMPNSTYRVFRLKDFYTYQN